MGLSEKQQNIVDANGKVVVKACPGSGKTYSVAARIADKLKKDNFTHQGIAAISFTNTAWKEINEKLTSDFDISTPLPYPHFVGTLDSFFNHYVFLPYGHLVMKCSRRPEIVGKHCHNRIEWSNPRKYNGKNCIYIDPLEHFENVSFDKSGQLIPVSALSVFNFSWMKQHKKDGTYIKKIQDILEVKNEYILKGYANQSDANYFTLQIFKKYPLIAENIASRFPVFIIDEAQDTNDIQMDIIDSLVRNGLNEIMLVGDPNQAIFEWNNANSQLFKDKYDEWTKITLDENRRSSQNICDCSNFFIGENISIPLEGGDIKAYSKIPEIIEVDYSNADVQDDIIQPFLDECCKADIELDKIAILYRSKSFQKYFESEKIEFKDLPWETEAIYLRDIVQGKYLIDSGDIKQGFKLIEQGFLKAKKEQHHIKREDIQKIIDRIGYVKYKTLLFKFIDQLPNSDKILKEWLIEASPIFKKYKIEVNIKKTKWNVHLERLFATSNTSHPYYYGTIHSAKGCTFDAVLLLLSDKAGQSNFSTLLEKEYGKLTSGQKEEVRNVYVAITRPRKILNIAVPKKDIALWEAKLKISNIKDENLTTKYSCGRNCPT